MISPGTIFAFLFRNVNGFQYLNLLQSIVQSTENLKVEANIFIWSHRSLSRNNERKIASTFLRNITFNLFQPPLIILQSMQYVTWKIKFQSQEEFILKITKQLNRNFSFDSQEWLTSLPRNGNERRLWKWNFLWFLFTVEILRLHKSRTLLDLNVDFWVKSKPFYLTEICIKNPALT